MLTHTFEEDNGLCEKNLEICIITKDVEKFILVLDV